MAKRSGDPNIPNHVHPSQLPRKQIHPDVTCDSCNTKPLIGERYRLSMRDGPVGVDLCERCYHARDVKFFLNECERCKGTNGTTLFNSHTNLPVITLCAFCNLIDQDTWNVIPPPPQRPKVEQTSNVIPPQHKRPEVKKTSKVIPPTPKHPEVKQTSKVEFVGLNFKTKNGNVKTKKDDTTYDIRITLTEVTDNARELAVNQMFPHQKNINERTYKVNPDKHIKVYVENCSDVRTICGFKVYISESGKVDYDDVSVFILGPKRTIETDATILKDDGEFKDSFQFYFIQYIGDINRGINNPYFTNFKQLEKEKSIESYKKFKELQKENYEFCEMRVFASINEDGT